MEVPHQNKNLFVKIVKDKLQALEYEANPNLDVVRLKSHKKKALMFALPNLPAAIGVSVHHSMSEKDSFIMDNLMWRQQLSLHSVILSTYQKCVWLIETTSLKDILRNCTLLLQY